MYIESEKLDTTKSNKSGIDNKEIVTNNHYQKLVMKNRGQIIDYKNGVTKNQLKKRHYLKMVIKKQLSKNVTKQPLPRKAITSKIDEMVIIVSNGY